MRKDFSGRISEAKIPMHWLSNTYVRGWIIPLFVAVGLFVAVRPAFAQVMEGQTDLAQYLTSNNVDVGSETVNGYAQVYYDYNGSRKFITSGSVSSRMPVSSGEYIAYVSDINGLGQVFLYNVLSESTAQLSFTGNNLNPKIDKSGKVVWEGWSNNDSTWQIYFFDGKSIAQLTSGNLSLNPEISGDYITFGRRDISETWMAILYSIKDKKTIDITVGEKARNPKIKDGKIYLAAGTSVEEEFPLTVDDLFLLNLVPLTATSSASPEISAPETVTTEEIIEELNASPSAYPASTGIPESNSSGQLEVISTPAP